MGEAPQLSLLPAPYIRRLLAFAIDLALFFGAFAGGSFFVGNFERSVNHNHADIMLFIGLNLVFFAYLTISEASRWQASLGQLLTGVRVVSRAGERCSVVQLAKRNAVKLFSVAWLTALAFRLQDINHVLVVAILFSISSNPIWHDFMAVAVPEHHPYGLVHDDVGRTLVVMRRPSRAMARSTEMS